MVRTQIQLTEEQARRVKRIAAERGVSVAEVIREAVERLPDNDDREERWARALAAVRRGFHDRDRATDVSVRHDDYLAEIYAE